MISIETSTRRVQVSNGAVLLGFSLVLASLLLPAVLRRLANLKRQQTILTAANQGEVKTVGSQALTTLPTGQAKFQFHSQARKAMRRQTEARRFAGNERVISNLVKKLNDQFLLPFDVVISLEECGEPDAYYDADTHQITVCYEIIDAYYSLFGREVKKEAKLNEAVEDAIGVLFVHETGHALVDVWKLPVTGREEDAVDQLATLVLINGFADGERMALNSARSFKLRAREGAREKKLYWDEHSQDAQRYYDTLCLIYGRDPNKHASLVKSGALPDERAEMCKEDYERVKTAWTRLLAPYSRDSLWVN